MPGIVRREADVVARPHHVLLHEGLDAREDGLPGVGRSDLLTRNSTSILGVECLRVSLTTVVESSLTAASHAPGGVIEQLTFIRPELSNGGLSSGEPVPEATRLSCIGAERRHALECSLVLSQRFQHGLHGSKGLVHLNPANRTPGGVDNCAQQRCLAQKRESAMCSVSEDRHGTELGSSSESLLGDVADRVCNTQKCAQLKQRVVRVHDIAKCIGGPHAGKACLADLRRVLCEELLQGLQVRKNAGVLEL